MFKVFSSEGLQVKIHSFKPKTHQLEDAAWLVFGLHERISLKGF